MFKWLFGLRPPPSPIRDTDGDWEEIGRDNPYYGVLIDPRFKTENLTPEALKDFFLSGEGDVRSALETLQRRYPDFSPRSALDFGCGVGRLTRALANVTGDAFGVDVSPSMVSEAQRGAPETARFGLDLPDRVFDWIVSIIVFQHIPPERGYGLLKALLERLGPGGCVTLQFALYRDVRHAQVAGGRIVMDEGRPAPVSTEAALRALPKGEMVMFDYDLTVIAAILFGVGVSQIEVTHTDHGGFHGAFIHGRKSG